MYLKDVVVDKPKGVELCPSGKSVYVYYVLQSTYHADKKYNTDKRISIGKMVGGFKTEMIPNDRFAFYFPELLQATKELPEPPRFSQNLHAGAIIAERPIAKRLGLTVINCDSGTIYLGCDGMNFNTEAEDISLAEFGAAKDDPTKLQVNLAVAVNQADSTPLSRNWSKNIFLKSKTAQILI